MGHSSCCVVNCKNTGRNSKFKFYRFPTASYKHEQRRKWIAAVRRKNADGSPWYPGPNDLICSEHFIGGKKSDLLASPSYIPTIFPLIYRCKILDESEAISRHRRFMEWRKKVELSNTIPANQPFIKSSDIYHQFPLKIDQECQVDIFSESNNEGKTFTCNRYIYNQKKVCDAEIQTEIDNSTIYIKKEE